MAVKTKNKVVKSSLTKRSAMKFIKNPMAVIGLIVLITIIGMCICAPLLTKYPADVIDMTMRNLPWSEEHPFGTDRSGRDMFARLLYGGRWSLFLGITASFGVNLLGAIMGCVAGYFGGRLDRAIVNTQEFLALFPTTILFILVSGIIGRSIGFVLLVWIVTGWGGTMRQVRGKIMSLKQEPFVESCRANGISSLSIMFHHMVPNTLGPIILNATMNIGGYILSEAGLSYLGIGLPVNVSTWGNIINGAKRVDILLDQPDLWMLPGVCIMLVMLSVTFVGDGLRDALDSTTR